MLIPKALVRRRLCLDSQEFYNYYIDFLQAELEVSVGFASALRGASGRVTKERVKEKYPFDKEALAKFATEHPDLFDEFRKIMESADGINDQSIDPDFVYSEATQSLISEIRNLPAGRKHADKYEKLVQKALTLLTWPDLTFPTAQRQLHQGTKRLDIEYWIYAKLGFWADMRTDQRVRARVVSVECKNYNDDIGNNEIDQLSGRFGRERGFLGLIFYRKVENEEKLKRRLESYVIDQRGYILAVSDKELIALLNESRVQRDKSVRHFFTEKFRRLISFA